MLKYFLIIAIAPISSCDAPIFSPGLKGAHEVCAANDGIEKIDANSISWYITVKCNNGAEFKIKDSLPK
jgi:hypothetical protein